MEHVQNIVEKSRRVQYINICLSVDLKSITIIDAVLCAHEHPILLFGFSLFSTNLLVVAQKLSWFLPSTSIANKSTIPGVILSFLGF